MKKIVAVLAMIILVSCAEEPKDFVSIKGKLIHPTSGNIVLQGRNLNVIIKVDSAGNFSDTVSVTAGVHNFIYNKERIAMFLKNGYDLTIGFKSSNFSEGISFLGIGKETNSYMEKKRAFFGSDKANPKSYFEMDQQEFEKAIQETKNQLEKLSSNALKVDSMILKSDIKNNELFIRYISNTYPKAHANGLRLARGTPSPTFINYENYTGGTSSLNDFKGKYVYIDVWATWCGPCKSEIPYLKELEMDFQGKNIEFVSLSVDKKTAYETWKKMIASKKMGGVQLFADNDFNSEFVKEYAISSIPRFILLDTEGKIIDADVSRPSNPKTKELLKNLVN